MRGPLTVSALGAATVGWLAPLGPWWSVVLAVGVFVGVLAVWDVVQPRHTLLRNFPVIGHLRYVLESIGPELRQYIITDNDAERPFSRDQRRWVYATAKGDNDLFGFGSDNDLEAAAGYVVFRHAAFPARPSGGVAGPPDHLVPMAKVLGGHRGRRHAFRPDSIVHISSMSFGSLSAAAVSALNEGAAIARTLHGTGEGGISPYHGRGGDLVWQLGTGYFGARDADGRFDMARFLENVEHHQVRAVEIKLSQGAKPGLGGMLPGAKVTAEIAAIRGIPVGVDCKSPAYHEAFSGVDEMLDFVETLAEASGLPVGIKSAVGQMAFWEELAEAMATDQRAVDFITIDGGEGGTGAAPLVFADRVALPFVQAFSSVFRIFAERGIEDRVVWFGSGRLGLPDRAALAFALGVDGINVAREAMLALGCIQAQKCHTGHCPVGIATQSRWLQRGLDPSLKAHRVASYLIGFRKEMLRLANALGVEHPAEIGIDHVDLLDEAYGTTPARERFGYKPGWGVPDDALLGEVRALLSGTQAA